MNDELVKTIPGKWSFDLKWSKVDTWHHNMDRESQADEHEPVFIVMLCNMDEL